MGCGQSSSSPVKDNSGEPPKRRQSVVQPPPVIPINVGSNVKFQPPPHSKVIVVLGRRNRECIDCRRERVTYNRPFCKHHSGVVLERDTLTTGGVVDLSKLSRFEIFGTL